MNPTTEPTTEPLALVAAVIDALSTAEAALIGPSDEYEGCAEALAKVRAVLHGVDRTAPISAAMAQARAEGRREGIEAALSARGMWFGFNSSGEPDGTYCTVKPRYHDRMKLYVSAQAIRALSDAPAPAVTVAEAARVLLDAKAYDACETNYPLDAYGKSWMKGCLIWLSDPANARALAEGGAGRG